MDIKEIYYDFIYGLLHGAVTINRMATLTNFSIYGNIAEVQKGKLPSRICGLYFTKTSKGQCLRFNFQGECLDTIWKFGKNELDSSESARIDINNIVFDYQVKNLYGH